MLIIRNTLSGEDIFYIHDPIKIDIEFTFLSKVRLRLFEHWNYHAFEVHNKGRLHQTLVDNHIEIDDHALA